MSRFTTGVLSYLLTLLMFTALVWLEWASVPIPPIH